MKGGVNLKIAPILDCGLALLHLHQVRELPRRWRRIGAVRKRRGADGHHRQLPTVPFWWESVTQCWVRFRPRHSPTHMVLYGIISGFGDRFGAKLPAVAVRHFPELTHRTCHECM